MERRDEEGERGRKREKWRGEMRRKEGGRSGRER